MFVTIATALAAKHSLLSFTCAKMPAVTGRVTCSPYRGERGKQYE